MQHTTNDNAAIFLLDGDEFFEELHRDLEDLLANGGPPAGGTSYVRIAYWMITCDLYLPNSGGGNPENLLDKLREVAMAGYPVQIIAWKGNKLMEVSHDWLIGWVHYTNKAFNGVGAYEFINCYTEPYGGDHYGCSNHQKIALVSVAGNKRAFVGGFNVSGGYLSSDAHNAANRWHDTAVRVRGPVVDDIETEWVRRWNKQTNVPVTIINMGGAQAAINAMAGGGLDITTCTNNVEASPLQAHIRTEMITRINAAQNLIYMENYGLTDPFLVDALAHAVNGTGPNNYTPQVTTLVDNMDGVTEGMGLLGSYLMYYTFLELSLPNLANIDIIDGFMSRIKSRTTQVAAGAMLNRSVTKTLSNPAQVAVTNPSSNYRYRFTTGGTAKDISFGDIWGYTPGANPHVMYTLSSGAGNRAYPHSKLAIFDDNWLTVGTSNWTYRSMQYDGEITLFINDTAIAPNFVTAARDRLFTHWNQPNNPANWDATARANVTNIGNGTYTNQVPRIIPVRFGDFIHPSSSEAWKSGFSWLGYTGSALF